MAYESLIATLTLYYQTLAAIHHISPTDILPPPTHINIPAANKAAYPPQQSPSSKNFHNYTLTSTHFRSPPMTLNQFSTPMTAISLGHEDQCFKTTPRPLEMRLC